MQESTLLTPDWTGRLVDMVSLCLELPREQIATDVPLSRYGVDSLACVELTQEISDALGTRLPESLFYEEPTIAALAARIERESGSLREPVRDCSQRYGQQLLDAVLPPDVQPEGAWVQNGRRNVLLTGANGFLGTHLLHELLRETDARIHCIVRAPSTDEGKSRVMEAMARFGLEASDVADRIEIIPGDIEQPRIGLPSASYRHLASQVDAVYHMAATVNWVAPYNELRRVNVLGTLELLRLACTARRKAFHFVSSTAVCHVVGKSGEVTEEIESLEFLEDLPLGYAQSKAVAESLVLEAMSRGLDATIIRPSFISGHSASGQGNTDDFVSRLLRGCIDLGAAPDLDWSVDCCPVDHVARSIARLTSNPVRGPRIFHVHNAGMQHWRKAVLWLNLYGYTVELMPYDAWCHLLRNRSCDRDHPLYPLRPFFLEPLANHDGYSLPELYQEERCSSVSAAFTAPRLEALGLPCPSLSAALLERYFAYYRTCGAVPAPIGRTGHRADSTATIRERLVRALRFVRSTQKRAFEVQDVLEARAIRDNSIIAELTTWRSAVPTGLYQCRVHARASDGPATEHELDLLVKVKAPEDIVLEVGREIARLCGRAVGRAFSDLEPHLALVGSQRREVEAYALAEGAFSEYVPHVFATVAEGEVGTRLLALESVPGLLGLNAGPEEWTWDRIRVVIEDVARIHAEWLGRERELQTWGWLHAEPCTRTTSELAGAYSALAQFADPQFERWTGGSIAAIHRRLIDELETWRPRLDRGPRTLIHNDFTPRNLGLRVGPAGYRLCAFDWELAAVGLPQRDLAEFLCFACCSETSMESVLQYLEWHRLAIERRTGTLLDPDEWIAGFRAALYDLLINRLSLYAVVHRVHPQRFLPRVLQTWLSLYLHFPLTGGHHGDIQTR